jgi:glucose-1-phosphatase
VPSVGLVLASLRPSLKTAVVSNAWPNASERCRTHWNLHEGFDELVFSCEVGLAKPDPAIYETTCERLGVPTREAVFIDDKQQNVEAAAALGMRGVLSENTQTTISAVRRLPGEG